MAAALFFNFVSTSSLKTALSEPRTIKVGAGFIFSWVTITAVMPFTLRGRGGNCAARLTPQATAINRDMF